MGRRLQPMASRADCLLVEVWTLGGLLLCFLVGAILHRSAGMGLALVSVPAAVLLLGPATGVTLANVATVFSTLFVLRAMRGDVDWARFLQIGPLVVIGAVPGMLLVRSFEPAWLDVVIGGSVLLGFAVTTIVQRGVALSGRAPAMVAGLLAGTLNTAAGTAGPAMVVYRIASRWEPRSFAATLQPVLLTASLTSVVIKEGFGASTAFATVQWWLWPAVAVAVVVGLWIGRPVGAWLGPERAGRLTVWIGATGASITFARGLWQLLT